MDKYVLAAVIRLDETKALRCVEPFNGSHSHRCSPVDQVEVSEPDVASPLSMRKASSSRRKTRCRVVSRTSMAARIARQGVKIKTAACHPREFAGLGIQRPCRLTSPVCAGEKHTYSRAPAAWAIWAPAS